MRRAQVEMIGLVFVVVIIVLGIILYMQFSKSKISTVPKDIQRSNSFLVALTETTIPACRESFSRVAQSCVLNEQTCEDPCGKLKETMQDTAKYGLAGSKYSIRVEDAGGTLFASVEQDCTKNAPAIIAAPKQPLPFGNGQTAYLVVTLCR
jgi:hypothetical protein